MNKFATIASLVAATTAMTASADHLVLLIVDLSVVDSVTISATDGLAAASSISTTGVGLTLDRFFDAPDTFLNEISTGNLTTANQASDGSPALWSYDYAVALNIYHFSVGDSTTAAGYLAFTGSATWTLDSDVYMAMLNGNITGNIYMGTSNDEIFPGPTFIGTWNVIPAPSSLALLGLGGIVAGRRRR